MDEKEVWVRVVCAYIQGQRASGKVSGRDSLITNAVWVADSVTGKYKSRYN